MNICRWFLIRLLAFIDPQKPKGTVLFEALARVTITVAFEAVALRHNKDRIEVFMSLRGPDESYAGQWHCPGSVMRVGESEDDVFRRLAEREFGTSFLSPPVLAGIYNNPKEERGHFYCPAYLCQIGETSRGRWFPVNSLPENTVMHHREQLLPIAFRAFNGCG